MSVFSAMKSEQQTVITLPCSAMQSNVGPPYRRVQISPRHGSAGVRDVNPQSYESCIPRVIVVDPMGYYCGT